MKLLIFIDQKASIASGYEAPHSSKIFDVPVAHIPPPIRGYIAEAYDPVSGRLSDRTHPGDIRVEMPLQALPIDLNAALAWLQKYYNAHQAAIAKQRGTRK